MPLRTRLAAVHGDADLAAKLLAQTARDFDLDIERLLATEPAAPTRRGLRGRLSRPGLPPSPGFLPAPVPATWG